MTQKARSREGRGVSEKGQALIETMVVLPFFLLLMMCLAEFGIYFYRANLIENAAQQFGRLAARNATLAEIQAALDAMKTANPMLDSISPALEVRDAAGASITEWASDDQIEMRLTASAAPVMPIGVFNMFGGVDFFPASFSFASVKQVYVE